MFFFNYCLLRRQKGRDAQIYRVMRITAAILLALGLHVTAAGYSQKVTLNMHNESLEKVVLEISRQSGIEILYNNDILRKAGNVTISVQGVDAQTALLQALSQTRLAFKVVEGMLVISPKVMVASVPENTTNDNSLVPIRGKVTDPDGKPLASVSITNKSTKMVSQTDAEGNFSIPANEKDILEFSIVGYTTQQRGVSAGMNRWSVVMVPHASSLNEVVMIGYGSSRKKDVTGSVSTVDTKEIENMNFNTVDNALAGKAAGVQVTKTDGTPGGAVRIRVRGSTSLLGGNDPLYVIDGVPLQVESNFVKLGYDVGTPAANDLNAANGGLSAGMQAGYTNGLNSIGGLNIDDIESISILKDASATAIYGSKAANGVVIINTKKGKKDMKPQITASYYSTYTKPINPTVLNASQYKTLITEAAQNDYDFHTADGSPAPSTVEAILDNNSGFFGKGNTDWLKLVSRDTYSHNAQVSIQGGSAASRYYTSVSYSTIPGVIKGTDYQRVGGVLNLQNDIGNRFRFFTNLNLGYTSQNITNGAYGQALRARPDYTPYDSTGNFTNFADVGPSYQGFQNPLAFTTAVNNAKTLSLLGSISAEYDILTGLRFRSTASLNMQQYTQINYTPSYLNVSNFYGSASSNGGIGTNSNRRMANWFVENTLTYDKKLDDHALNVLAGTSYETRKESFFSATGSGYPNDNILNNLSSAVTPLNVNGDNPTKPQSYLLSFYMRANYSYADKYLLTFTGRTDGSSKFGPDNKFAYFPSGAVAWRLSNENFMKDISWIEDLKLRGSYGLAGTQNIGDQMYRTLYTPFSYAGGNALIPTQLGNPGIRWETTKEIDGGLDLSLFKGRLQATFDYYHKRTNGILLALPTAPSSSYTSLLTNVANITNQGYEISLKGDLIHAGDFKWNTSINITWNRSVVNSIENANPAQIGNQSGLEYGTTALIPGQPLGLALGYKVNSIIRTQKELDDYKARLNPIWSTYLLPYLNIGDPVMALKSNGAPAQQVIASCAPKFFGGFTHSFSYRNFDLSAYFTFSEGGKLVWADDVSSVEFTGTSNANVRMLERYTADNPNASRPRLVLSDSWLPVSNLNVYNSSYIKLRSLGLNYRFNKSAWMDKAGIKNASIYLTATNLFTITKYPGNDPETSDDPYSVGGGYYDVGNYPPVHTFSLGAKLSF